MQVYANSNRLSLKTILFFIVVLFIAFLPISSFLFFLKNDAFTGYFPPKFFMSESIHAGYLPLWNPYINFGIPAYGDMSCGYWSPFTWLIAAGLGYNAYTFTLEVLMYILIGGIGMYKLTTLFTGEKNVALIAGIAFMCCGYNIGHLQHFNWLSGAAFLPWCFWSYYSLLQSYSLKNSIRCALIFYLLISAAHPGITIAAIYFFIGVFIFQLINDKNNNQSNTYYSSLTIGQLLFIATLLLLSAGMIAGYADIIPFFVRGEKISIADSLSNPTNIQSWISAILPFSTVKNDAFFDTDPSMRNVYFGITLLLFFLSGCFSKKTGFQQFLLGTGILFALLSAGSVFKTFAYKFIPFIGYVRLNGEFRIFTLLCFIVFAAISLNQFIARKNKFEGAVKWVYYLIEVIVIAAIITGLYQSFFNHSSVVFAGAEILAQNGMALKLKACIDHVSFSDTLWIQGFIQLLLLWSIKWCLKNGNFNLLKKIAIADMVLASLINIPFTGVGKASVAQVQQLLNQSPKGIPVPPLIPVNKTDTAASEVKFFIGDWSWYNKQIGVLHEVPYPIALKDTRTYFEAKEKNAANGWDWLPYVFSDKKLTGNNGSDTLNLNTPKVISFSPEKIQIDINSSDTAKLILQQSLYPHWFYNNEVEKKQVKPAGYSFMYAPLQKGNNKITFSFEPLLIKYLMLLSAITLVLCCIVLFIKNPKSKYLS